MTGLAYGRKVLVSASASVLVLVLVLALALALASPGNSFEISPSNPSPGEEIIIKGTADPGEEVDLRSSFQMNLPVIDGRYEYETSVEIPQKPNRFTVTARNVEDLNAGVKMVIWITRRFEATGGVATISQSDVPPGRYALKMFGEAVPGATVVPVKVEADTSVKADSKGDYRLAIDTSGIPAGDYSIEGDGDSRTIRIGSPSPSVAATPAGSGDENGDEDTDKASPSFAPSGSPISATAITSEVIRWYAGKQGLDPDDPEQYLQAENSLRNRVKGDYWRVIAMGQPLTEAAGNCEEDYCLVRGIDACTICRDREISMAPKPETEQENPILNSTKENLSGNEKETLPKSKADGDVSLTKAKGPSEEKGFIGEVLEWIMG